MLPSVPSTPVPLTLKYPGWPREIFIPPTAVFRNVPPLKFHIAGAAMFRPRVKELKATAPPVWFTVTASARNVPPSVKFPLVMLIVLKAAPTPFQMGLPVVLAQPFPIVSVALLPTEIVWPVVLNGQFSTTLTSLDNVMVLVLVNRDPERV